ncbi:MAG: DMT family transporter [Spirochaetaceae bacterium]|nr:DMT family transporter [Spirochaetaceae bacterium]
MELRAAARSRGIALALVSAAGFSTLGLFAKLIYAEGFSVPQALAWRFTIAAAFLWVLVLVMDRSPATRRPPLGRKLVPVLLLGLFGFVPQAGLYFLTVSVLDPGIASLLLYLYPSFVIVFSFAFLRRVPTKVQAVSLALAIAGCAFTFFKPGQYPLVGLALGVIVAIAYGAYLVAGERVLSGVDSIRATAVIMVVAVLRPFAQALPPPPPGALAALPLLPCPAALAPSALLFRDEETARAAGGELLPPILLACATRALAELVRYSAGYREESWRRVDRRLAPHFERLGPWLYPRCAESEYEAFFRSALSSGVLLSPAWDLPSLVPGDFDDGELAALSRALA